MCRLVLIVALLALSAAPALAQDPPGNGLEPIAIGVGCSGSSFVAGHFVSGTGSGVTLSVEDGKGPALAFMGARLLLPVASNANGIRVGSLRRGQWIRLEVTSCPNAEGTTMSMVAGRILTGGAAGETKTVVKRPAARSKSKKR